MDKQKRNKGKEWSEIRNLDFLGSGPMDERASLLTSLIVPGISLEEWQEIVDSKENEEKNGISNVKIVICPAANIPSNQNDFNYKLDDSYGSAWTSYKRRLSAKGFGLDSIHSIQTASHKILNKISLDTRVTGPLKGLVIGNVQSGKTANMAALMAMAADQGWNMFIILSGTIENLRIQTQKRLISDLNTATNVAWVPLDNVSRSANSPQALSKLTLAANAKQRYLMVCLKNSSRLKNLLYWLAKDAKQRELLKILFIDDEADQAGINAARQKRGEEDQAITERTKINQSLVNLFMNKDDKGKLVATKFRALDYVAYTATPYANILNEKPGPESIYPANFVSALPVSNNYIGPQAIFGIEGTDNPTLNLVNTVSPEDLVAVKDLKPGKDLPQSLKDAIMWFYCCLAIERIRKADRPFSMLIHTSQRQQDHQNTADAIKTWFENTDVLDFVTGCKAVYEAETKMLSKSDFYDAMPDYPDKNIQDYPDFKDISDEIVSIFKYGLSPIKIDEEGNFNFTKGVHLCIDNCAHNFVENGNEHIRLLYPEENLGYASGFIVVGGATLSRGLTIEGLVSTYFLRTVKQADTLMQMGRWFGYRTGYELLPRIWLTENTKNQFVFLSNLDYELRVEMKNMEESGVSPSKVGIRIRYYPKRSVLEITSKNKAKAAVLVDMDYSGFATQTTMFYSDHKRLQGNYDKAVSFIQSLGNSISMASHPKANNYLEWDGVDNDKTLDFITSLEYPKNDTSYLDVKTFKKWYQKTAKKNGLEDWHVIVAGLDKPKPGKTFTIGGNTVCEVNRSKKKTADDDGLIRIGALRAPRDVYIDIDMDKEKESLTEEDRQTIKKSTTDGYRQIRQKCGMSTSSQLVIYFIDKDSQPRPNEKKRVEMGTDVDVIGLSLIIPDSDKPASGSYVSIDLSDMDDDMAEVDNDAED